MEVFHNGLDALCDEKWFRLYGNCLCILALIAAKYGAGFTWRQTWGGYLAYIIWQEGCALLKRAEQGPRCQRVTFRIELRNLRQAFIDAGIYGEDELEENESAIWESLGPYHSGYITITWLQWNLYFMQEGGSFWNVPDVLIRLKPFGARAQANHIQSDLIILQRCYLKGSEGYELALIKAENSAWPEGPDLILMKLPDEFFRILQEPINDHWWTRKTVMDYADRHREILEGVGLKYWHYEEAPPDAWEYRGKYASLKWWEF